MQFPGDSGRTARERGRGATGRRLHWAAEAEAATMVAGSALLFGAPESNKCSLERGQWHRFGQRLAAAPPPPPPPNQSGPEPN